MSDQHLIGAGTKLCDFCRNLLSQCTCESVSGQPTVEIIFPARPKLRSNKGCHRGKSSEKRGGGFGRTRGCRRLQRNRFTARILRECLRDNLDDTPLVSTWLD